jgi:uncharacterized protein YecE (DUF72 family)
VIRIGCSGWSYEHWRGVLYPRSGSTSRWLELYAQSFDTVEINASFYRLPNVKTVARWASVVPDEFLFAVKASRYLTHVRRLRDIADGVKRLGERIEPLRSAGKLGPILWQLPPNFTRDDARLESALEALTRDRHAFEFRDPRASRRGWPRRAGATSASTTGAGGTATTASASCVSGQAG